MSDLRNDVEKKGKRTMKLRKPFLLWGTVALAGCAHVDPNPAFRELANTVHMRTGKRVQWNHGTAQDAEAQAAVASLLHHPLTADAAVQLALLNNRNLQATYEELGLAQADLVEAGLLRNPIFTFERRFPGQAMEMDLLKEFIDILFLPLRKRIAAAQFEAAKLRVGHEILKTAAEVRAAFYEHQGDAILQQAEVGAHYEREISGEYAIGPSVNVPIPIFNQGQAAVARSSAKLRQSEQRYLALAADIRSDVRAARDKMLLSRRQVEYFKSTALPTRTRVTEESQLEYNAMQIGPFQLLQAKQEEVKT